MESGGYLSPSGTLGHVALGPVSPLTTAGDAVTGRLGSTEKAVVLVLVNLRLCFIPFPADLLGSWLHRDVYPPTFMRWYTRPLPHRISTWVTGINNKAVGPS